MPARMFSGEGMMGLRSWRYPDGTASLRAVVAANSSMADGVSSALKPRRTRITPYTAAATARANTISEIAFQGIMSSSPVPSRHDLPALEILLNDKRLACDSKILMVRWRTSNVGAEFRRRLQKIWGDDQSGCLSVSSSSARPNAGRYRPKFN